MDVKYGIISIPEVDYYILSFLDYLTNFPKISRVNKYYYNLIKNDPQYQQIKDFYQKEKSLTLNINVFFHEHLHQWTEHFLKACRYGYFYYAQYLVQNYEYEIDFHFRGDYAFRWSCREGHLKISQWLYENIQDINIHHRNEYAFKHSCGNGHLEMAQWLYSLAQKTKLPINIHVKNEKPFRYACMGKHIKVAQWLYEIGKQENHPIDYQC
jgi:hypothetical protein